MALGGAAPENDFYSNPVKIFSGADRVTGPEDSDLRADSERICDDGSGVSRYFTSGAKLNLVLGTSVAWAGHLAYVEV